MIKMSPESEPDTDGLVELATSHHQAGLTAADAGQLVEADVCFDEALAILALLDQACEVEPVAAALTARILMSKALPAYELEVVETGLELLQRARERATEAQLNDLRALIASQHGLLLLRAGRATEALRQLDRAARLISAVEPVDQCKILMNRGVAHQTLGQIGPARQDFARAVTIAENAGLTELAFRSTHNLGFAHYLAGELPRALAVMPTVADASSDFARGVVGLDRAQVLLHAGLVTEAEQTLEQACLALSRTDLIQVLAEAELVRAEAALLANDPQRALDLSRQAGQRFAERHNESQAARAELVETRAITRLGAADGALIDHLAELSARMDRHGLARAAREARLLRARLRFEAGEDLAPADLRLAVAEPITARIEARRLRADLAYRHGDRPRGSREVRAGLRELADYQQQFGSLDLQISGARYGVALAASALRVEVAADRPAAVLTWLERAREFSGRVEAVGPPRDPINAELLAQLRWVAHQRSETEDPVECRRLEQTRRHLEREVRARAWARGGDLVHAQQTSARTVSRGAGAGSTSLDLLGDATLVTLFGLDEELYAVMLRAGKHHLHRLGPLEAVAELERRVTADLDVLSYDLIPEPLRLTARRSLATGLAGIERLCLDPLELPPNGRVVVVPPGRLATVPWSLLPGLRGRPVAVADSVAAWGRATRRLRQDALSQRVLTVAGPGLSRATAEVEAIGRLWPGSTSLTGADANGQAVLEGLDGARLVHLAAHGHHVPDNPLFSSVRLADGPIVAYDLDALQAAPSQVVLSACELGRSTVRGGNESLGLTRALLHAGTATVVAGVAKVSDEAAALFMLDYHRRLASGLAPADALAQAGEDSGLPAPFLCFGAGW